MSASIIDAFVATLGLDGTLFRKGMEDAEKSQDSLDKKVKKVTKEIEKGEKDLATARRKRQKEQDDAGKKTSDGYKKARTELLGLAALFTAGVGFKNFIANTIDSAANLGYLSANLRMSTQDLTSWQRASERAGGSSGGIVAQLKESADTLAQFKSGFGPNEGLQNFFRFGGNADDLKDGNTYLLARSKIISEMFKQDPAKAALIARQMGVSEDQFDFLKQGPAAVLALVQAQEKNAVITAKDAQSALELKNKFLDLRDSLQATTVRILTALLPSLNKLGDWILSMTAYISDNKDVIAGWVEKFINADWSGIVNSAKEFVGDVKDITKNIRELIDRWDEWTGKSKVQTPGVTKLAGAIRIGKTDDLNNDNVRTGKPVSNTGRPKNATLARISDIIDEGVARTLASFGVQSAKEWVRDNTGKDDYLAGPKMAVGTSNSVMGKLIEMGWSKEQAAGIAGSFTQESDLNPAKRNPKSGAYGIGQWLAPRAADFKAFSGRDLVGSSLDQQLAFFNYEVTQGKEKPAGDRLRATTTAEDAARVHSEAYERPGSKEANIARRQALAAQYAAANRTANANAVGSVPAIAASSVAAPSGGNTSTATTDVHIDSITVNTQATDAQGIASALRPAIEKYNFGTQANTGMR